MVPQDSNLFPLDGLLGTVAVRATEYSGRSPPLHGGIAGEKIGLCGIQSQQSNISYVYGSIMVTVMCCTATAACPVSVCQREVIFYISI